MKQRNNKGSSIVLVLVVFAIVGILATAALRLSVMNFQMKATDSQIKNNFYSAESVLDQVTVGLQNYVSDAYTVAYTETMEAYASSLSATAREAQFKASFMAQLKSKLADPADASFYNASLITSMVDSPSATVDCGTHRLVDKGTSITLCDVTVTYTDAKDITSIIKTDINIAAPSMRSVTSTSLPDLFSYSLIANSGISIEQGNGQTVTVSGNVYAGSDEVTNRYNWNPANRSKSICTEGGATVIFSGGSYVTAEGDFYVSNNSKTVVDSTAQLWAQNIVVDNAEMDILSNTYVADDLTLNGRYNTKVILGTGNSKYYGYGDSTTDAASSSAIILNGKNCDLDMSGLDELAVAGYSYIGTSRFDAGAANPANGNVQMGESISVKGNQIAYLIPGSCIGTNGSTASAAASLYSKNPMTMTEYQELEALVGAEGSDYVFVNGRIPYTKTGKSLSDYLNGAEVSTCVQTVFDNTKGLVYFYANLPADEAEQYYSDYYTADKSDGGKLDMYTSFYSNQIKYNSSPSMLYTAGTYVSYDGSTVNLYEGSTEDISSKISRMPKTFEALTTILSPNFSAIQPEQKDKTVFENFINTDVLNDVFSHGDSHGINFSYTDPTTGFKYRVIIAKQGPYNLTLDTSKEVAILITSSDCDIVLNSGFRGIAICDGKISAKGNSYKIEGVTEQEARRLMAATFTAGGKTYHAYELFKGGNASWVGNLDEESGGSGGGSGDGSDSTEAADSYADLITYSNWQKK